MAEAPIRNGDVIGERLLFLNESLFLKQPVYAQQTVEKFDYRWCLRRVLDIHFLDIVS